MSPKPRTIVLTGFGINCDYETENAFRSCGATVDKVHVNDIIATPTMLDNFQIMAVPGGFSFGDDLGSGKVLANKLKHRVGDAFRSFLERDTLVIGICNGFQVLARLDVFPDKSGESAGKVSLTFNDSGRFEDRWVEMKANPESPCVFTREIDRIEMPVRHGEGKFVVDSPEILELMEKGNMVALRYTAKDGGKASYPDNPNGSVNDIAGICDSSGRVFGLMPHPEAHVTRYHHPHWTRREMPEDGAGLKIFANAVSYFS